RILRVEVFAIDGHHVSQTRFLAWGAPCQDADRPAFLLYIVAAQIAKVKGAEDSHAHRLIISRFARLHRGRGGGRRRDGGWHGNPHWGGRAGRTRWPCPFGWPWRTGRPARPARREEVQPFAGHVLH